MQEFRQKVRSILETALPADLKGTMISPNRVTRAGLTRWQRILDDHGLWLVGWPEEYGGTEASPAERLVLESELVRAGAPSVDPQALYMVGPVIYTFGSDEQKAEFLPKIKRTDIWWCQGFSEPNAGSDLFGLRTRADRDGDEYVINGRKIWTSRAHWADFMFAIFRTPGKDNEDNRFSFFLLDMKTPGLTIRPIPSIDGNHHLNEVIFDNVRAPVSARLGKEGQGKEICRFLLTNERITSGAVEEIRGRIRQMQSIYQQRIESYDYGERGAIEAAISDLQVSVMMLESLTQRAQLSHSDLTASTLKILSTEIEQRSTEVLVQVLGSDGLESWPSENGLGEPHELSPGQLGMMDYLFLRAASIYGGTNEVQHNIIYKMLSA